LSVTYIQGGCSHRRAEEEEEEEEEAEEEGEWDEEEDEEEEEEEMRRRSSGSSQHPPYQVAAGGDGDGPAGRGLHDDAGVGQFHLPHGGGACVASSGGRNVSLSFMGCAADVT